MWFSASQEGSGSFGKGLEPWQPKSVGIPWENLISWVYSCSTCARTNVEKLGEEEITEVLSLGRRISMDHVLDPGFLGFCLDGRSQIKLGCDNGL